MSFCEGCGSKRTSAEAKFCGSCGREFPSTLNHEAKPSEGTWTPSVRATAEEDFEDRFFDETGTISGLIFPRHDFSVHPDLVSDVSATEGGNFKMAVIDGYEVTSWHPWWFCYVDEDERSPEADFFLRGAAARGSIYALAMLMNAVYESQRNDWEAWRWAKRLLFLASNPNRVDNTLDEDTLAEMVEDATKIIENVELNMPPSPEGKIYLKLPHSPKDVGIVGEFNYCLACGRWRRPDAPLDQCDDSVHLSSRSFGP